MPRYHFNVMGEVDEIGAEFPSPLYARREGMKLLGALLAGEEIVPRQGLPCLSITDATGAVLFELSIAASDMLDERAA